MQLKELLDYNQMWFNHNRFVDIVSCTLIIYNYGCVL